MPTILPDDLVMTDEELRATDRFLRVLRQPGVQVILTAQVVLHARFSEAETCILDKAIADVLGCSPRRMHEVGVSLDYVIRVVKDTPYFHHSFMPSEEAVRKCVAGFWESLRNPA